MFYSFYTGWNLLINTYIIGNNTYTANLTTLLQKEPPLHNTINKNISINNNISKISVSCHYIGWIGYQNIGDEVLYQIFQLTNEKYSNYFHIDHTKKKNQNCEILGGGSLIPIDHYVDNLHAQVINGVFGSGTDDDPLLYKQKQAIFTPEFIAKLLKISSIAEMNDIKRSFCANLNPVIIVKHRKLLSCSPMIIRGYITKLLMDCAYIETVNATSSYPHYSLDPDDILMGDSGMLGYQLVNNSKFDSYDDRKWLEQKINSFPLDLDTVSEHKIIRIAVNIGGSNEYNSRSWDRFRDNDDDTILNVYVESLLKFHELMHYISIEIIIWSIWPKDNKISSELANKLNAEILTSWRNNIKIFYIGFIKTTPNIIRIHQLCDISLTYKLHAMILSHSALCPGVHLAYRLKILDHASVVNLTDYCVSTGVANDNLISKKLVDAYNNRILLKKQIHEKRIQINEQYKKWWRTFDNVLLNGIMCLKNTSSQGIHSFCSDYS